MKVTEIIDENAAITQFLTRFGQNMAKQAGAAKTGFQAGVKSADDVAKATATRTAPAAAKTAQLTADVLAAKAAQAGVGLVPMTTKIWDQAASRFVERSIPIVNYDGRAIVIATVDGVRVPFYLSTGSAGKKNVPSGKWYPIFGIGPDGWINKGTEAGIAQYYGLPNLRKVAQQLDASIGDIRSQVTDSKNFGMGKPAIADINQGLNPVAHSAAFDEFKSNAYGLFRRLGAKV